MEPAGVVAVIACAVALLALAPAVSRAWRRRQMYAGLAALSLAIAALALLAAVAAQLTGAARIDTGRFLIGMSAGLAVGLTAGCAILLRVSPPLLLTSSPRGRGGQGVRSRPACTPPRSSRGTARRPGPA